ncbi:tryptophan halogenase family protein [Sphingomonas sp. G-3-2-10]|uniref:tryptophan halogenase family protein n=1 Tax=Sphingomonas sp. G-3-2-10 TaxID=2728838 RepID=UPI00146F6321|nr:tryptophan halogenase family protein [Sphingomonas sp. G-3-2-10]NML07853.1 tryptophan 7-halogenase [Sphingomonas sp. G-3-2-10]
MSGKPIHNIVIVGGGTAGWMCAAALSKVLGSAGHRITLIESDAIGIVGVGEATVPSIREFNRLLQIDEDAFLRATKGTIKLGIEFADWGGAGQRYFHPFGYFGIDMSGVSFHHYWLRNLAAGGDADPWHYNLEAQAAATGRFARDMRHGPVNHAFHFDAGLYARFLRGEAEGRGVVRVEGEIVDVAQHGETGHVTGVTLRSGEQVEGDFFVDCSGFRGLLIEQTLKTGYVDWSHWLPCDRAVAMPCARVDGPVMPYTRSTAREAGWQWRIPLQHRTGNGYVYCSRHLDDDRAVELLASRLDGAQLADANRLRFTAGHRRKCWNGNVVALGLASGFLEPLESTSIHLIQTGIIRLLGLLPRNGIDPAVVDRFNADTVHEYALLRDFVLAHYAVSSGVDTPFWREVREAPLPDSLAARIEAFRTSGNILNEPTELFGPTNWFAILWGQGVRPGDYHPIADALPRAELDRRLALLCQRNAEGLSDLPPHEAFLARHGA